ITDGRRRNEAVYRLVFEGAGAAGLAGGPAADASGAEPGQTGAEQAPPAQSLGTTTGLDLMPFNDQPVLMFWTDPTDLGMSLDASHFGHALVSDPLSLRRPERGTYVAIPPSFVPFY